MEVETELALLLEAESFLEAVEDEEDEEKSIVETRRAMSEIKSLRLETSCILELLLHII